MRRHTCLEVISKAQITSKDPAQRDDMPIFQRLRYASSARFLKSAAYTVVCEHFLKTRNAVFGRQMGF